MCFKKLINKTPIGVFFYGDWKEKKMKIRKKMIFPEGIWKKGRMLMVLGIVFLGSIAIGESGRATANVKELASREITDAEYNGTVYSYAVEKQFEVPDENMDVSSYFKKVLNDMELQDISYETVEIVPETEIQTLEETKDYKELIKKDETQIKHSLIVDGEMYTLKDVTWTEEPNNEHVSYTVEYGYQTKAPNPAATYEYTYTSPVTKKENTVTLPFVKLETGDTTWVDGFSAIVTLHNLDGDYFTLGNHEFTYDPDSISFTNSDYKEIVRMLKYDTGKYRLNNAKWKGKAYQDADGVTCRDIYVTGQQYAANYRALYEGDVENGKFYTAHAKYTREQEVETDETEGYVVQATAYYQKESGNKRIIMSIGIVIFLILVIAVLYVTARKKKVTSGESYTEEEKNEQNNIY